MAKVFTKTDPVQMVINMPPAFDMSDAEFFEFCQINSELRIERTAQGDLIIMPPTGGETGDRNAELTTQLRIWAKQNGTGVSFDSSTGFILPNGATRSPDGSWVKRERLAALTGEQKKKFLPLCPDFVIELRSPSDSLTAAKEKMEEYLANSAQLGWLIDTQNRQVYIYRPDIEAECLDNPQTLSGESSLPGFSLDLRGIWEPGF
ncbi:MAG: Uma2 family endonuclease [Blastocatellia bacterium]|nr:Uma2 family endonuclease [Blastocatellia bacterium]